MPELLDNSEELPEARIHRTRLSVAKRREQLLAVGAELFTGRAFEDVSTEEIAKAAGVSQGLLFHYFGNKQEFYVAVLRRSADEFIDEVFEEREGEPLDRLVQGIAAYFEHAEKHAPRMRALLRGGGGGSVDVDEVIEATRLRVMQRFIEHMPPEFHHCGGELRTAIYGWLGFVESVALDHIDHGDVPLQARIDLVIRVLAAAVPDLAKTAFGEGHELAR